jgi:hypothetical protein
MFKECYALEKIHGTSAWISYTPATITPFPPPCQKASTITASRLDFFAGGGDYSEFVKLFDAEAIHRKLDEEITSNKHVHIYGEYYGGKMMKMSRTYGGEMNFVAFEVKIGDCWLNVPKAEKLANSLGLEFVYYKLIPVTMEAINAECDDVSVQAIRNGMKENTDHLGFCPPVREGIVLRPLEEVVLNSGDRVIAKHKREQFRETNTPREVSPEKLKKVEEAKAIANEWVTRERLNHILGKGVIQKIENTGQIIALMTDDIIREAAGEIVDSPSARKEIARQTALLFKERLKNEK